MVRTRTQSVFLCEECGTSHPRWVGRCTGCGAWGSVAESATPARAARTLEVVPQPVRLGEAADPPPARLATGMAELDRVLGGGIVPGSLILIGGEPGIGKSTLVLQALASLSATREVLLVTGEESVAQVRTRAARLVGDTDRVGVLAETRLESVVAAVEAHRPAVCAIDSVQTLVSDAADGGPGSVSQVRQATGDLLRLAKERDVAIVLVGQVTKDGGLAGPRMLEHMVDCVLTFEGEEMRAHRVLRATKNRFGSTNESGVLEMRPEGLVSVPDPSSVFLAEVGDRVGSCVFPAIEGSRAVLVEVQALVGHTEVVPPRRVAVGVDRTRLAQVIAVLSRHAGMRLGDQDVFVSVAGGARANDPAADLAIALAIASAHRGVPLTRGSAAFGEIGLTGGIRPSGHAARRLGAISAQGLELAVMPRMAGDGGTPVPDGLRIMPVGDVAQALEGACTR
ncbi:MAG: DNA repair protein RadA [Thermoleophilia bacterium]|nr:DNA repair protein RadA [Thermoleophilia bacterium]